MRNLLICMEMVIRRTVLQTKAASVPEPARWQAASFLAHKRTVVAVEYLKTEMTKMADLIYEEPRAMPSFCILNCRVDRFIARRVAAPFGPATTQLHSLRALRICWRSVSSKTI